MFALVRMVDFVPPTAALPQIADILAGMSVFRLVTSALPQTADLKDGAAKGPVLTLGGHFEVRD